MPVHGVSESQRHKPDFNFIARPYRWLEYVALGRTLEHCRFALLPLLRDQRRALIIGDGDGRFLSRLLQQNSLLSADIIDLSSSMLRLSRRRAGKTGATERVRFHQADARDPLPAAMTATHYDLVVTHFFLDCLSESEVEVLIRRVIPRLEDGAVWLVSDFAIPHPSAPGESRQKRAHLAARVLVRSLYFAFRLLTGLRIQRLPDYSSIFQSAGFSCRHTRTFLHGVLRSELWQYTNARQPAAQATAGGQTGSH